MQNWVDYLNKMIDILREEMLKFIKRNQLVEAEIESTAKYETFPEPCQIKVLDFGVNKIFWLVSFDAKQKDKTFTIYENIKEEIPEFLKKRKDYPPVLEQFYKGVMARPGFTLTSLKLAIYIHSTKPLELIYLFLKDPRKDFMPEEIANIFFERIKPFVLLFKSRNEVTKATKTMERQISNLKEVPARSELLKSLDKLEKYVKKTDSLQEEVRGVRTLIGISEEFKDWKLLVSDVDKLKQEHVSKDIFQSELQRIIEKIEAFEKIEIAYERLSSQQEKVLEQQSGFLKWIKYSIILVPITVALIPIIEILIKNFLNVP